MSQTATYTRSFSGPFAGQILDVGPSRKGSKLNLSGVDLPAGVGVIVKSTDATGCDVLADATHELLGVTVSDFARDQDSLTGTAAIKSLTEAPLMVDGPIMVAVDQDITGPSDKVFVRFAASANAQTGTVGMFRKDADGAAQVTTGTPTAANSTIYVLRVEVVKATGQVLNFVFEYISDGSATATEIVTGFKTAMAADSEFTALVVATGTTTLVMTGQTAGLAFTVTSVGDGAWASITTGTPAAPTARRSKGSRWLGASFLTASGAKVAPLYFSAAVEAASF